MAPCVRGRGRSVLFVTSSFPRWSGDSTTPFIYNLAEDLQLLGWKVHVLAPHADGARTREDMGGIAVERFRYCWPASAQTVCYQGGALVNLRTRPTNLAKLPSLVACELLGAARRLAGRQFSIVHSHWLLPQALTAGIAARALGVPHVATIHGGDVFALRGKIFRPFKRAALRLADVVTVNSSATLRAVCELDDTFDRVQRVPMGAALPPATDMERVAGIRDGARTGNGPLIAFVGRLIPEKGVGDLVAAIALVRKVLPDVSAVIVGDGPDRAAFEDLARSLAVADRVQFVGWADQAAVAEYLHAADVFVGPSKRSPDGWVEAQGLVFVEAMLAGLPVIATASGGIGDLVRDQDTGLLVEESSPEQIAHAIVTIHRDADLRSRLRERSNRLVQCGYSRAASASRFSAIYAGLLNR